VRHRYKFTLGAIVFLLLSQVAWTLELHRDVEKSPNDKREYAYFTLANKLDVLVISDKTADKAAASLDIHVGSANDPEDFAGLAHFLEHMLFLGTAKYPEAGAYQKFISEHGGGHNAYTALENTNYFFDVNADYLEDALDRFSQQFTAPLFNKEYVQREVNAVHSEYSSKIQDDGRRYLETLKSVMHPKHPYRKFAVGNLSTLADKPNKTLREALLDFYDNEYSANRMKLTVLGKEDLSTLAKWVEDRFSDIPNKDLPIKTIDTDFFSGGFLPAKLTVENVMDTRSLSLSFPVPSTMQHIHSQPLSYIANLIGHEGTGSLLSALKDKQLVDTLSAGGQFDTGERAMFIISMSLTQEGMKRQDEIIKTVFSYIDLVKTQGVQKLYFDEQAKLSEIGFKFREKIPALSYVRSLSSSLHDFEAKEVLAAHTKLTDFNPELIEEYLSYLTPNNMLVSLRGKNVTTDKQTEYFKAPYAQESLSISLTNALKKTKAAPPLALPEANAFIPESTDLVDIASYSIPKQINAREGVELWHAADTDFCTPKATLYLSVRSPYAMDSAKHLVMTQLLVSHLKDELVEFSYPAYLAGLSYDLYKHLRGVTLKISGYNDKQEVLLDNILNKVTKTQLQSTRFPIIKERLKRGLENEKEQKPFQQAIGKVQEIVLTPAWSTEEKLAALKQVSFEDLQAFKKLFFSKVDTVLLSNGNIIGSDAEKMAALVEKHLIANAEIQPVERAHVRNLANDATIPAELEISHPDTGVAYYMQGESKSFKERAEYAVMAQAISTDFYTQLRTEKQLGYVVFASPYPILEVPGLAFIIQSPNASPATIYDEIHQFLNAQKTTIANMAESDFDRHKKAVISRLEEKETNIAQRSNRYWSEIDKKNYQFNSKQMLIDAVTNLALEDFKAFYSARVDATGSSLLVFNEGENAQLAADGSESEQVSSLEKLVKAKRTPLDKLTTFN